MRKVAFCVIVALVVAWGDSGAVLAQTEGTTTFRVTTINYSARYAPRHVLAVWVTDSSGAFVRTLLRRAEGRRQYLYTWNRDTGGNSVDAITGATLSSHQTHTVTWDGRTTSGAIAPDGEYRIRAEFTSEHSQGPLIPSTHVAFTKGPEPASSTPANLESFRNMSLTYAPDVETHTVIEKKSTWKYHDGGVDLHAQSWKAVDYNDASWSEGAGILGYGDSPATTLSFGGDGDNKHPCYYLRRTFDLTFLPDAAKLFLLRDDGAVVYLNGEEVARDNMSAGATAYGTLASSTVGGDEETAYFLHQVDPSKFVIGKNVIAVEAHQADVDSSDLSFDLELKTTPPPTTEDPVFIRGDVNGNATLEITDAVSVLNFLFLQGDSPPCLSAADSNDNASLDISDGVAILLFLFVGEATLPPPHPACGVDPTPDDIGCELGQTAC